MDFNTTPLSSLINTSTKHTVSLSNHIISILDSLSTITENKKLVLDKYNKIFITEDPKKLPINHPITQQILYSLERIQKTGDEGRNFIYILKKILKLVNEYQTNDIIKALKNVFATKKIVPLPKKEVSFLENLANESLAMLNSEVSQDKKIKIVKINSGILKDSFSVKGFVINKLPIKHKKIRNLSCLLLNGNLELDNPENKSILQFSTPDDLLNYSTNEEKMLDLLIESIKDVGFIFVNGSINKRVLETYEGVIYKLSSKYDLMDLQKISNGYIYNSTTSFLDKEIRTGTFKSASINDDYSIFESDSEMVSIVLKDSLEFDLEEHERKIKLILSHKKESNTYEFIHSTTLERKIKDIISVKVDKNVYDKYIEEINFIISTLFKTQDYLITKEEVVKPKENKHWDECD
ncbi:hypothetical protein H312_02789 [Anncaliia algerae PRA339]|uniref:Uncharacterized protein n=1 Tax=Anncaliia algerae PRA339 TaxID=1288291 RepID=A0A059EYM2_9MICR|nr:hypothetical protein H312_02789 [Anncaliia algerae PRA339]